MVWHKIDIAHAEYGTTCIVWKHASPYIISILGITRGEGIRALGELQPHLSIATTALFSIPEFFSLYNLDTYSRFRNILQVIIGSDFNLSLQYFQGFFHPVEIAVYIPQNSFHPTVSSN